MPDKLIELTSSGLRISTKDEIKDYMKKAISEAYGSDINFNPSYPDGIIVEALSVGFRDTFEAIQGLYNSFNIRNSSGVMLDTLSNLVNVHRKKRTQASATVGVTLQQGRTYLWAYFAVKDQNNNIWRNLDSENQDLTLAVAPLVGTLELVCDKYGEVEQPSSFTILSPIATEGIALSLPLTEFIQGSFDEDDISLRDRTMNTPIRNSVAIKEQLIKLLLENKFVKSVKVYNNDGDSDYPLKLKKTLGDVGTPVDLPPTQIAVIVQYNENLNPTSEDKNVISNIIANYKGLCTITFNPTGQIAPAVIRSYSYEDPQNPDLTHDIFYIEAKKKASVGITITISQGVNYNSTTTQPFIKTLVTSYLGTLKVGEDLVVGSLMSYLYENADKQFLINNITLGSLGDGSGINNDEYYASEEEVGYLTITISGV